MTVRELIQMLAEFEMDTDITLVGFDSHEKSYEEFDAEEVKRGGNSSGNEVVEITFDTERLTLIDVEDLKEIEERIEELEDKLWELKNN